MNGLNILLAIAIAVILAGSANGAIYLGTADGYIFNMGGGIVQGADVSVSVSGCSGGASNGCSGDDISQSNGYYVVANLNVDPGGSISVLATAQISGHNGTGSASATANQFSAARVNVTMCFSPSAPALIDQGDSHNNSVTLYWNPGTDPFGYSTYDEFQLDSGSVETKSSPVSLNVSYAAHTWKVRTCNTNGITGCCSPFTEDSFTITNSAPLPPTLVPQNDTHESAVTLYWTNGSDPDGDNIYHQFQFGSQPIQNNSFSPISVANLTFGSYTWRVRACDFVTCGAWASDTFDVTNNAPSLPNLTDQQDTTSTSVNLDWQSGTDPEGDTTYDDFQFSDRYDFSNLIHSVTNASHPFAVGNLSLFEKYYWRVRTCDSNGCSAWVGSYFITYSCQPGSGGVSHRTEVIKQIVEKIVPGPPIEVTLPPAPSGKTGENATAKEVVAAEKEAEKEMAAEVNPEMGVSFRQIFADYWWILLIIILIIALALWSRKRNGKKTDRNLRHY